MAARTLAMRTPHYPHYPPSTPQAGSRHPTPTSHPDQVGYRQLMLSRVDSTHLVDAMAALPEAEARRVERVFEQHDRDRDGAISFAEFAQVSPTLCPLLAPTPTQPRPKPNPNTNPTPDPNPSPTPASTLPYR